MKLASDKIKKIAIFRALQLGDMLCAIPGVRALRHAYPNAAIVLIGLPWAKSFTQRFSRYFDDFIEFPGYPGLPEQPLNPGAFTAFLAKVQAYEFDLAIQIQGNGTIVNPMIELFGAAYTAGFSTHGHYAPDNGLFMPYPDYGPEVERHILLMQHLGINARGSELEFPLTTKDYDSLDALELDITPKRYVCVHPGSRGQWRQWPTKYFASLADYCIEQGYKAVITGTTDELEIVESVISHMRNTPINAAGRTSMGGAGVLIQNAAMLISNCTGVSHIAAAFKTPSIVISMDGEPHRWGPADKRVHRTINWLEAPDFHSVFRETVEMVSLAAG
ncbi:LPS biosynthesis glycosyltransferase [Mucilaginibacter hurinus]|uniref:LPS biosynthesis glycosyltransferase n=1 Tax=Mucilaginibacter hurinus TaxID=2201324 RepID=A0A367GQF6_9SPHI|nr:glycosyltransferase family 9 protein [Mucilaginibacter hurinus]RCH55315.1 LPS biosynthesis glycosyltransferase [Mucilaginibacter hurinus]